MVLDASWKIICEDVRGMIWWNRLRMLVILNSHSYGTHIRTLVLILVEYSHFTGPLVRSLVNLQLEMLLDIGV